MSRQQEACGCRNFVRRSCCTHFPTARLGRDSRSSPRVVDRRIRRSGQLGISYIVLHRARRIGYRLTLSLLGTEPGQNEFRRRGAAHKVVRAGTAHAIVSMGYTKAIASLGAPSAMMRCTMRIGSPSPQNGLEDAARGATVSGRSRTSACRFPTNLLSSRQSNTGRKRETVARPGTVALDGTLRVSQCTRESPAG